MFSFGWAPILIIIIVSFLLFKIGASLLRNSNIKNVDIKKKSKARNIKKPYVYVFNGPPYAVFKEVREKLTEWMQSYGSIPYITKEDYVKVYNSYEPFRRFDDEKETVEFILSFLQEANNKSNSKWNFIRINLEKYHELPLLSIRLHPRNGENRFNCITGLAILKIKSRYKEFAVNYSPEPSKNLTILGRDEGRYYFNYI